MLKQGEKEVEVDDCMGGTVQYAAPEVLLILQERATFSKYDPFKADVYSLAVVVLDLMGETSIGTFKRSFPLFFLVSIFYSL